MKGPRRLLYPAAAMVALAIGLAALAVPSRPPAEVLRHDLDRILSQAEYRQGESDWLYALLLRALRSALAWWRENVADRLEGLARHMPVVYWAVVVLNLLLAVLLIYHIYVTLRSAFGTGGRHGKRGATGIPERSAGEPQALLQQAEAAAAQGHFGEALRYLYLALIHHLDRVDVVRYDISHTNQEYLRQARQYPAVLEPLRAVTTLADRAWYGHYTLGWNEYERCHELVRAAWEEAEHAAAL